MTYLLLTFFLPSVTVWPTSPMVPGKTSKPALIPPQFLQLCSLSDSWVLYWFKKKSIGFRNWRSCNQLTSLPHWLVLISPWISSRVTAACLYLMHAFLWCWKCHLLVSTLTNTQASKNKKHFLNISHCCQATGSEHTHTVPTEILHIQTVYHSLFFNLGRFGRRSPER